MNYNIKLINSEELFYDFHLDNRINSKISKQSSVYPMNLQKYPLYLEKLF